MGVIDSLIGIGAVLIIFGVVGAKVLQNNPRAASWLKETFNTDKMTNKIVPEGMEGKMQQVYDERRSMM